MNRAAAAEWASGNWQLVAVAALYVVGGAMTAWGIISAVSGVRDAARATVVRNQLATDHPKAVQEVFRGYPPATYAERITTEGWRRYAARTEGLQGRMIALQALYKKYGLAIPEDSRGSWDFQAPKPALLQSESAWVIALSRANEKRGAWLLGAGIALATAASVWALSL